MCVCIQSWTKDAGTAGTRTLTPSDTVVISAVSDNVQRPTITDSTFPTHLQIVDWLVSYIQRHPLFAEKASEIGRDNAVRLAGKLLQAGVITRISTPASNNDESDSSLHFKDTPSALYDVDSSRALQINED